VEQWIFGEISLCYIVTENTIRTSGNVGVRVERLQPSGQPQEKYTDLQVSRLIVAIRGSKTSEWLFRTMFWAWRYGEKRAGFEDPEDPRIPSSDRTSWPLDAKFAMLIGGWLDRLSLWELNFRAHLELHSREKQCAQLKRESQRDQSL